MKRLLLASVLLLLLGACTLERTQEEPETLYPIYYSALGDERAGAAVDCVYQAVTGEEIPGLMSALLTAPSEPGLSSPIPAGVRLLSWSLESGQLHLDLSEQYGGLTGMDLTMADSCITLPFCGLEWVESVYITVEGREIPYRRTQVLTAQDIFLSGAEEEPVYLGINLWYPRSGGEGLGVEYRSILKEEGASTAQTLLDAWLEGPQYDSLLPCAPEGTHVHSAVVSEGVCTVDLSGEFVQNAPADPQEARRMIYALVNTLGELERVDSVLILCQGEPLGELGGVSLAMPLAPDLSLDPALEQAEPSASP